MAPRSESAFKLGKEEGYRAGFEVGWKEGCCEAIKQTIIAPQPIGFPLRLMYVPQGFEAIDSGIIEALRTCVQELHVANREDLVQQVSVVCPDLVLVLNGLHIFPENHLDEIDTIRAMGIRTAVWFVDDPYMTESSAKNAIHYDIVLTHELSTISLYKEIGCEVVHYCPLAVNEALFKAERADPAYASDVCFIGQGFWNRIEYFDTISERLAGKRIVIVGQLWERLKDYNNLKPFIKADWVSAEECTKYYNAAKIVINMHRTTEVGLDNFNSYNYPGYSINPRTFEIASCAALQLTDVRQDLERYYRPDYEIATYSTADELSAKIDYYLSHEEERHQVALRGYYRTLRDHTFAIRMTQLLQMIIEE